MGLTHFKLPLLILAVSLVTLTGNRLEMVVLAIIVIETPRFMRLIRSEGLSVREARFVEARQEEFKPPVRYPRDKGYRPTRKENPYNAWFWKTEIRGAPSGPLAGLRVGVKDTICVAGVPMINGGRLLEGYVPDIDATVVSRLLDAGATIVGKTTVNDGAGESLEGNSPLATVRNPRKPTHGPGGSSNGSAAALATGEIDLALGGDQGGSIRIPASWSGVVGLKPTYGRTFRCPPPSAKAG